MHTFVKSNGKIQIFTFFLILWTCTQTTVQSTQNYKSAVVEYKPEGKPWEESGLEIIAQNVRNYADFIRSASAEEVDIIVFPEYGLTTLGVPRDRNEAKAFLLEVPDIGRNPCEEENGSDPIIQLSCEAKSGRIYVVVNLGEIRNCSEPFGECPPDRVFQFNTNVVFDRNGTVLAKYEKVALFFEEMFDKGEREVTFTTDFGVTFGLLTSFDMFFYKPGVQLVDQGVKAFVFPTAWWDELPFNTAIQTQSSWAFGSDSLLLAAAYHQPGLGQLGSGIYQGRKGTLGYTSDSESGSKMVIATVNAETGMENGLVISFQNKSLNESETGRYWKGYQKFLHEDLQNYTTKVLNLTQHGDEEVICTDNGFCCEFAYQLSSQKQPMKESTSSVYRIVAFNGTRPVAQKTSSFDWQVCGLLRCGNLSSLESCTEVGVEDNFSDEDGSLLMLPKFEWLRLSATFDIPSGRRFLPMINAIGLDVQLVHAKNFDMDIYPDIGVALLNANNASEIEFKTVAIVNKLF